MKLVLVESPAKASKFQDYLGGDYEVMATVGHIRDIPRTNALGVDLESWEATYEVSEQRLSVVSAMQKAAKRAEHVYLASDYDREGEAIAWHLVEALKLRGNYSRVRFNSITESAIKEAIRGAGPIDTALVDAQQARRILDRVVGWKVSPLLRPLGENNSAGRVQSAALHLIVEREKARENFNPEDFWTLGARYSNGLKARYAALGENGDLEDVRVKSAEEANAIVAQAQGAHIVKTLERKPREQKAPPPFTTDTLQQEAGRRLKFAIDHTMKVAQRLYEAGHITYLRTDAVNLSDDAVALARDFIAKDWPAGLPDKANVYKSKANAQEAHEAIRPTSLSEEPSGLDSDATALYELIRRRFLACQTKPAVFDTTTITIESGTTAWRAKGSVLQFEGWKHYAGGGADEDEKKGEESLLPKVGVGEVVDLKGIDVEAKQTKPPPRFTLLTLSKELTRLGIGRPSTSASLAGEKSVLLQRGYIVEDHADPKKSILPQPSGRLVDAILSKAFGSLVAADYTAQLEQTLDEIAEGHKQRKGELRKWWSDFSKQLEAAPVVVSQELRSHPELAAKLPAAAEVTDRSCPLCSKPLVIRTSSKTTKKYLSCSAYPECKFISDVDAKAFDQPCPKCSKPMLLTQDKEGRPFARCADSECKTYVDPTSQPWATPCPKCSGAMEVVTNERGRWVRCKIRECKTGFNPDAAKYEKPCPLCSKEMVVKEWEGRAYARCVEKACKGVVDLSPPVEEPCPICTGPMKDRGEFLSCARYPVCKGSWDKRGLERAKKMNRRCPKCSTRLLVSKKSTKGEFVGCSGYPECKHLEDSAKPAPSRSRSAKR